MNWIMVILKKIQLRGMYWLLSRLLQEAERGTSFPAKLLKPLMVVIYWMVLYPLDLLKFRADPEDAFSQETLYLFYDLEVSPVTFDFSWALALAEQQRKNKGLKNLQVVFVPGEYHGLRQEAPDYETRVDYFMRIWRRNEILYPMCDLIPSCLGITVCATRREASILCNKVRPNISPDRYSVTFPIATSTRYLLKNTSQDIMSFESTLQARRYIQQWLTHRLKNRKLITITLRNTLYLPARNSNLLAWYSFVKELDTQEYFPVFLSDTDSAMDKLSNEFNEFLFFNEPAWNLNLRAALYEMSYLNLGVNNGVMALCWLNAKCRYITFKMILPETSQIDEAMKPHGFKIGQSLPFSGVYQKWVWENDDFGIILREFNLMCGLIEGRSQVSVEKTVESV